jgi:hypothetical protein
MSTTRVVRRVLLVGGNVAVLAACYLLLVPSLAAYGQAWLLAHHLPGPAMLALAGSIAVSVAVHVGPFRAAIPELGVRQAFLLAQSNFAISNLVPAGSVVSTGVSWSMLRRRGRRRDSPSTGP